MKEIPLTRGYVAMVDDEDYDWLMQWKWCAQRLPNGHVRAMRGIKPQGVHKVLYMHREIMKTPTGMEVDHIDHNGLNNQKSNLRNCSHRDNLHNHKVRNGLGYKGLQIRKGENGISVGITVDYVRIYLGSYPLDQVIEAARCYDRAALKYFGDFAHLNFPEEHVKK